MAYYRYAIGSSSGGVGRKKAPAAAGCALPDTQRRLLSAWTFGGALSRSAAPATSLRDQRQARRPAASGSILSRCHAAYELPPRAAGIVAVAASELAARSGAIRARRTARRVGQSAGPGGCRKLAAVAHPKGAPPKAAPPPAVPARLFRGRSARAVCCWPQRRLAVRPNECRAELAARSGGGPHL